ncbi:MULTISPECIES: DegV family protein [Enterococcus]|uniref:DegV family protein n=1 Tax=Enterococcus sulfureus ATCC 49903 TaxID=1140003 RepID=S0P2I1_9ENTE|nr:DegV family protein [Enterococcus sulfureus]EOT45936.1 DegV family protein [Enterococcus sulfureus ATCC 49903]EOT83013.1 DegV family protein [Enterococcus sulfureus ATCC 49903]
MTNEKIAVLVDSGTDVPVEITNQEGVYTIPLQIIYKDAVYKDKIDITPEEVYARLSQEIPSTSLPDGGQILAVLDQIKSDGYNKIIAVSISSGLSGTYNILRLLAEDSDLEMFVLDSKNIGIGAGLQAIHAYELIQAKLPFNDIVHKLKREVSKTTLYFNVATLEYLQKGGRIGLVSSIVGTALRLNPTISCNEDGIYYTVAKTRGRKKSLENLLKLLKADIGQHKNYRIAVAHGDALEEGEWVRSLVQETFPEAKEVLFGTISPALVVHTGPGLVGLGVQLFD